MNKCINSTKCNLNELHEWMHVSVIKMQLKWDEWMQLSAL